MAEDLPVRYCHGCKQYDDHPRLHLVSDMGNVAADMLYHYDCLPDSVQLLDNEGRNLGGRHPAAKATSKGLRGADVRQAVEASNLVKQEG